jgi:hypothetical protein
VQPRRVVPVHPGQGGQFDVVDVLPRTPFAITAPLNCWKRMQSSSEGSDNRGNNAEIVDASAGLRWLARVAA